MHMVMYLFKYGRSSLEQSMFDKKISGNKIEESG